MGSTRRRSSRASAKPWRVPRIRRSMPSRRCFKVGHAALQRTAGARSSGPGTLGIGETYRRPRNRHGERDRELIVGLGNLETCSLACSRASSRERVSSRRARGTGLGSLLAALGDAHALDLGGVALAKRPISESIPCPRAHGMRRLRPRHQSLAGIKPHAHPKPPQAHVRYRGHCHVNDWLRRQRGARSSTTYKRPSSASTMGP